jgi:hypothetical protein
MDIVKVVENSPQTAISEDIDVISSGVVESKRGSLIAVPDSKEWEILHLRAQWTASAVVGTRQPVLAVRGPTGRRLITRYFGDAAANQVITVEWGSVSRRNAGAAAEAGNFILNDDTDGSPDVRSSSELGRLILPAGFQIAFYDAADIQQANTIIIRVLVIERDVAVLEPGREAVVTGGRRPR